MGITQKWLPVLGQENGYFCWSNCAIFQGISTVLDRLLSLIHKKFEAGPKRRSYFSPATHNWERYGCRKPSGNTTLLLFHSSHIAYNGADTNGDAVHTDTLLRSR